MTTLKRMTASDVYELIPSIYRLKDSQNGYTLRAFIEVMFSEGVKVEDNISQLYDNWFIDTCEEWIVPYIGELLGIRGLQDLKDASGVSRRAFVANTIGYRRRKGTVSVLEQLAFDITGWRSVAREFFQRLGWTQQVNHVKLKHGGPVSLKNADVLELTATPFDNLTHTVDVRSITRTRGFDNIDNVGIFLWRISAYRIYNSAARNELNPGRYFVHPSGQDVSLFNPPQSDTGISDLTDERDVPTPLRLRPLYDELEQRRQAMVDSTDFPYIYFDNRQEPLSEQAFELFLDGTPVPPEQICICNLSDWNQPSDLKNYTHVNPDGTTSVVQMPIAAAIDPVLGRIALPASSTASDVRISYSYGWPGDVGAGSYNRQRTFNETNDREINWQIGVSQIIPPVPNEIVATISEAIDLWNSQPSGTVGMITILDNSIYMEDLTGPQGITVSEGNRLYIIAAQWPLMPVPDGLPGQTERRIGNIVLDQTRPHIVGSLSITGTAPSESETGGEMFINGLSVEGSVNIESGNMAKIQLDHTTIYPQINGISIASGNQDLKLVLNKTVCGHITASHAFENAHIENSILHGDSHAIDIENVPLTVLHSTVIGTVTCNEIMASNSILFDTIAVRRKQVGCVRYCYVVPSSKTPRRYQCQPDMAIRDQPSTLHDAISASIRPTFTSLEPMNPAYCQLSKTCAKEITAGGEGGTEMGVWNLLQQQNRLSNLKNQLEEYMRFGMHDGIETAT